MFPLPSSWVRRALLAACLVLPLWYLVFCWTNFPSEPSQHLGRDATYFYLMNAYHVALGKWAYCFAHPGATLHLLGGIAVRLRLLLFRNPALSAADQLILEHNENVRFLGLSLVLFNFLCLVWATVAFRRRGVPAPGLILMQALWIFTPMVFSYSGYFQPESLALGLGAALGVALCARERRIFAPGFLAGAAVATKMNFLGFGWLVFLPKSARDRLAVAAVASIVFLLFLVVLYPEYGTFFRHQWTMALASKDYIEGPPGLPEYSFLEERIRWGSTSRELVVFPFVLALGLLGLSRRGADSDTRRALGIALAVMVFSALLYLRKPTHGYYLMPASLAIPSVLGLFLLVSSGNWRQWVGGAGFLLVGFWLWQPIPVHLINWKLGLKAADPYGARLEKYLSENKECTKVILGPLPLGVDAIEMGAGWAGYDWQPILMNLYPKTYFVAPGYRITQFSNEGPVESEWLKQGKPSCVFLAINSSGRKDVEKEMRMAREGKKLECNDYFCAYLYPAR